MKTIIITILLSFNSFTNFAQCKYENVNVDGQIMKQFYPRPVSADMKRQYALSINNFNNSNYLLLTIRFKNSSEKNNDILTLYLSSDETIILKSMKYGKDTVGGSEITHNQYLLNESDEAKLKKGIINSIKLDFLSGEKIYLETNNFKDYVKQSLICLQ